MNEIVRAFVFRELNEGGGGVFFGEIVCTIEYVAVLVEIYCERTGRYSLAIVTEDV